MLELLSVPFPPLAASLLPVYRLCDSDKNLPHSLSGHDLRRRRAASLDPSAEILHEDTVGRLGLSQGSSAARITRAPLPHRAIRR